MAKQTLSRQDYVAAALEIIAQSSVEQLSMRKVASHLKVSAMAMYKHFANKEALLSAALDAFIADAEVIPPPSLAWEDWVVRIAENMYQALCRDMSWVPYLGAIKLGEQAMRVTDSFVGKLTAAGFSAEQALRGYFTMIQLVIGAVCMRSSLEDEPRASDDPITAATQRFLNTPDLSRLQIAPVFDRVIRRDQLQLSLPLLIAALRDLQTQEA